MNVEKLFNGIAVIIDDDINDKESSIYKIRNFINNKNIPVATYSEIPSNEVIDSLHNASFVILDWQFNDLLLQGVKIPAALQEDEQKYLISFIKHLLDHLFIPIFIFSSLGSKIIIDTLNKSNLYNNNKERLFIKEKKDLENENDLFEAIEDWIKTMPSVYALKQWEQVYNKKKSEMFLKLYSSSSNWVKIIWDLLKRDGTDFQFKFGEFITTSLMNRMNNYEFEENYMKIQASYKVSELISVLEDERYFSYDKVNKPDQAYTGDLFKYKKHYYLNVRAQCDLSRKTNPEVYLIKGKEMNEEDIAVEDIHFTPDEILVFNSSTEYSLESIEQACKNQKTLEEINEKFKKEKDKVSIIYGAFIEKSNKVIIGCIDGKKAIVFDLNLEIKNFLDIKNDRIGRILPPYITRIQQKLAHNIIREGIMPMPDGLFTKLP